MALDGNFFIVVFTCFNFHCWLYLGNSCKSWFGRLQTAKVSIGRSLGHLTWPIYWPVLSVYACSVLHRCWWLWSNVTCLSDIGWPAAMQCTYTWRTWIWVLLSSMSVIFQAPLYLWISNFLSASLYFSKRGAYWDRLCRDVVGRWLVVTRVHCGQTVHPRPIVTVEH